MRIEEYKKLLLDADLKRLEQEIENLYKAYELAKEVEANFNDDRHRLREDREEGEYEFEIPWLRSITYSVKLNRYGGRSFSYYYLTNNRYKEYNYFIDLLKDNFFPIIKSYNSNFVYWDDWSKAKTIEKVYKKWDNYFEKLEIDLERWCGKPLQEIHLDNYSDNYKRSNGTVFGGPKGKAILWTTESGGYNVQQEHIRLYCKQLNDKLIKQFNVTFKD